jgi:hypothetical protein
MELGLTKEQKIQSLDGLKTRLNTELYSVLVTVGIDPDAFNAETWTAPLAASPGAGKYSRLIEILETLDLLNAKIAELS